MAKSSLPPSKASTDSHSSGSRGTLSNSLGGSQTSAAENIRAAVAAVAAEKARKRHVRVRRAAAIVKACKSKDPNVAEKANADVARWNANNDPFGHKEAGLLGDDDDDDE